MITHATNDDQVGNGSPLIWEMICGAQFVVEDNGNVSPKGDFFLERDREKATCPICRGDKVSSHSKVALEVEHG